MFPDSRKSAARARPRMATSPWCAVLLTLPLLACSSSSASNGADTDAGAVAVQDSGAEAARLTDAYVNAQMGDPATCIAAGGSLCLSCCEQTFPGASQAFDLARQDCLCGGSGTCSDACTDSDCLNLSSAVAACQACLQQRMPQCVQKGQSSCQADAFCKAYMACAAGCPM